MITGSGMLFESAYALNISVICPKDQKILPAPDGAPLEVVIVSLDIPAPDGASLEVVIVSLNVDKIVGSSVTLDPEVMMSLQVSVVGCGLQLPSSPHSTNVSTSPHW